VKIGRFFRTPKGEMLVALAIVLAVAVAVTGVGATWPAIAAAVAVAVVLDGAVLRWRKGRWVVPDGALLTALIVAMIIAPGEPWYVAGVATAVGVVSKYLFRAGTANIFNPAALGLLAVFFLFGAEQDWWGALPDAGVTGVVLLAAAGLWIAIRIDKLPVVVAFLGFYFGIVTIAAYAGADARVAELFRTPDLQAAIFFAFFMVTDPPTSPPRAAQQVTFGAIVALATCAAFLLVGAEWYFVGGVLVGNVWEALRRWAARVRRWEISRSFDSASAARTLRSR
jgi:Na+-translocating ferredoxin:NAD+ oxidoreductase RnfD subunit